MSIIGEKGDWDEQLGLAFNMYDMKSSGTVAIEAVREGSVYDHCDGIVIADEEFFVHDLDKDGVLNFTEFRSLCKLRTDLVSKVIMALRKIFYDQLENIKEQKGGLIYKKK